MSEQKSNLGLITIALTVVGIVVLTQSQEIGLTIIFTAILLYAGVRVKQRLDKMGAEAFAVGSIMVWTGFAVGAFPLVAFAWGFLNSGLQALLFVLGIILVILGYTTNYYDLNARLLAAWDRFSDNLTELLQVIRQRLFRSMWTIFAVVSIVLMILTLLIESIEELVPNVFGINYGEAILFALLAVLFLLIEFRAVIVLGLKSLGEALGVLFRGLWRRIRHFPQTLVEMFRFLKNMTFNFFRQIRNMLSRFVSNIYIISFGGMMIFGIWGFAVQDQGIIAGAVILLLIGLINLLTERSEAVGRRVGGLQQSAYQRSFVVRNAVQNHTGLCPRCETPVAVNSNYCSSCGLYIPDCMVCRRSIYRGEQTLVCPNCGVPGHAEHMERWLEMKNTCPNCRAPIIPE